MKVLITGALGQLGRCLQDVFQETDYEVFAYSRSALDITNSEKVLAVIQEVHPDIVINTAAYTAVDKAEEDAESAYLVNEVGPRNIAEVCSALEIQMVHISTDYVFDGLSTTPYTEDSQTNPRGVYGKSKLSGEIAVIKNTDKYCILRTAWVFSEYGNNFLKSMLRLGSERDSLNIVSDQIGCPTYAGDIANSILQLIPFIMKNTFISGIYHYCSDKPCTWYDFATEIFSEAKLLRLLERNIKVIPITTKDYPTAAKRPEYSVLDCSKLERKYGISSSNRKSGITNVLNKLMKD